VILLVTTNPGLEDLASKEFEEKIGEKVRYEVVAGGRFIVELSKNSNIEDLASKIFSLKTVHRVSLVLSEANVSADKNSLKTIYDTTKNSEPHIYLNHHTTFAIRSERIGVHQYTSLDVAKVAGQAVIDATLEKYGFKPIVNLEYPTVIFDSTVVHGKYFFSLRLSGEESLHKRKYRIYDHPAALKPTLAYSMLMIANLNPEEVVVDPMCGGGTIAIEAALNFNVKEVFCIDISPKHLHGAIINAISAGAYRKIRFILGDVRKLSEIVSTQADLIITNPPYGIRLFRREKLKDLYHGFLSSALKILSSKGRVVVITSEHSLLKEVATELGYSILLERECMHGNLKVKIMMFKPM